MPIELFPFRYRDGYGKWVRARYKAERQEIASRYKEWEIIGPPEIREPLGYGYFRPYPPEVPAPSNVDREPGLDKDERYLVLLFLRRYVTWCARRRRYGFDAFGGANGGTFAGMRRRSPCFRFLLPAPIITRD